MNASAVLTKNPNFGAHVGSSFDPGAFGMRLAYSADVTDCLSFLESAIGRVQQATCIKIEKRRQHTVVKISYSDEGIGNTRHLLDAEIALLIKCISRIYPEGWQPAKVCFQRHCPRNPDDLQRAFGVPVSFNHDFDGFEIDAVHALKPGGKHDASLCDVLEQQVMFETRNWPDWQDMTDVVLAAIKTEIGSEALSIGRVAGNVGMSVRTLQRKLQKRGVSFLDLVEQVRREEAKRRLLNKGQSVSELAYDLGYSDPAAFSRAFRKWQGVSPSRFISLKQAA